MRNAKNEGRDACAQGFRVHHVYTETANVMIWLPIGADRMLGEPV
jgi:hypothetical protein